MFSISNIGFVDGRLHIQVKASLSGGALVDGYYINPNFVNSKKEVEYEATARIDFITDRKYAYEAYSKEPHDAYSEFIYESITNPEQLNDLSVTIDYMKSPTIIEGNWEFSFMVPEKVTTEFHVDRDFQINSKIVRIDMVSLSPLGITVHLPRNMAAEYTHSDTAYVEYTDGVIVELSQTSIHGYEGESALIFGGEIIEIENVKSIAINGERFNISQ
jgi:hypothetical protein